MAAETITVYIDPTQLVAQKTNNCSLFLAKMVNGQFTVIWQSKGPIATVTNPAVYEYLNVFVIALPSYEVNYGTVTASSGSVTFTALGLSQSINIGQTVALDELGLFGTPSNNGTPGEITITNQLAGNLHAILLDNAGNPIFVNTQSGLDLGEATLTPIDTYQIWFDNYQDTGTIIAHNVSNAAVVTFSGGTTNQVISFNAAGTWRNGPLAQPDLGAVAGFGRAGGPLTVTVIATFKYALTREMVTYLLSRLIGKFSPGLRPTSIEVEIGSSQCRVRFAGLENTEILANFRQKSVHVALLSAKLDPASGLQYESWTLTDRVGVSY